MIVGLVALVFAPLVPAFVSFVLSAAFLPVANVAARLATTGKFRRPTDSSAPKCSTIRNLAASWVFGTLIFGIAFVVATLLFFFVAPVVQGFGADDATFDRLAAATRAVCSAVVAALATLVSFAFAGGAKSVSEARNRAQPTVPLYFFWNVFWTTFWRRDVSAVADRTALLSAVLCGAGTVLFLVVAATAFPRSAPIRSVERDESARDSEDYPTDR